MCGMKSTVITITIIFLFEMKFCEKTKMEPFIVNGKYAKIQNFPYCVYLFADCDGSWGCGSSILNQKILLTAAHCLDGCGGKSSRIDAFAGHEDFRKASVKRKVRKIITHHKYNSQNVKNDVGLALLRDDLPLGNNIKRVIITKESCHGVKAKIAGWGILNDKTNKIKSHLKWANQKVRSAITCSKLGSLLPGMICAGSVNENDPRPSRGDSGSALITANHRQIGVVSFRYPSYPGLVIYSNISYFYDWIKEKSRSLSCG